MLGRSKPSTQTRSVRGVVSCVCAVHVLCMCLCACCLLCAAYASVVCLLLMSVQRMRAVCVVLECPWYSWPRACSRCRPCWCACVSAVQHTRRPPVNMPFKSATQPRRPRGWQPFSVPLRRSWCRQCSPSRCPHLPPPPSLPLPPVPPPPPTHSPHPHVREAADVDQLPV